jgi:S1-C subfamily serine protease
MKSKMLAGCAAVIVLGFTTAVHAAQEKAWYGFKLDVNRSGFVLNPTVVSVVVREVVPNSPAAAQHISVGDEIIEAEGKPVPGNKALQLRPLMTKSPGDTLHLRFKRKDGDTYAVAITAVKRPY